MKGGLISYWILENNRYQLYILKYASNVVLKICDILGDGRSLKDHIGSQSKRGSHNLWRLPYNQHLWSKLFLEEKNWLSCSHLHHLHTNQMSQVASLAWHYTNKPGEHYTFWVWNDESDQKIIIHKIQVDFQISSPNGRNQIEFEFEEIVYII